MQKRKLNLLIIWFIAITSVILSFSLKAVTTQYEMVNRLNVRDDVQEISLIDTPEQFSDQLLFLFVDGMRYDKMMDAHTPNIDQLRVEGVTFSNFRSVLPSYSMVNYMSFATGSTPNITGVIANGNKQVAKIPSIFSLTQDAGLSTGVIASGSWDRLFSPWITTKVKVENEYHVPDCADEVRDAALSTIPTNFSKVQLIGFNDVDAYGHLTGAASTEYTESIEEIDEYLGEIITLYNNLGQLQNTTIVLFSDHGMDDEHGHGGIADDQTHASLVIAGKGIKNKGTVINSKVRMNDITPTLLTLLGIPLAATMNGRIIFDIIDTSSKNNALFTIQLAEIINQQLSVTIPKMKLLSKTTRQFYATQVTTIQQNITTAKEEYNSNHYLTALQESQEAENSARKILSAIYFQYGASMRLARSLLVIGMVTLFLLIVFILYMRKIIEIDNHGVFNKKLILPQFVGTIAFTLIGIIVFISTGFSYEPSELNSAPETIIPNLTTFFVGGIVLIFLPWLVTFLLGRKQKEYNSFKDWRPDFLRTSIGAIFIYSIPIVLYALYYIYRYGPWPVWLVPNFGYLYAYMIVGVFSCFYFISAIIMQIVLWRSVRRKSKELNSVVSK